MSDGEGRMLDRVANAIYQAQVGHARENVDKLHFDCGNMPDLFQRLASESETAQILIFSSFLEDKVLSLIKLRLFHLDSAKVEDAIFGSNGPLGTFGSRIALSYQLGWLSPRQKKKLDAFRKIRNEFAHNAFQIRAMFPDLTDTPVYANVLSH